MIYTSLFKRYIDPKQRDDAKVQLERHHERTARTRILNNYRRDDDKEETQGEKEPRGAGRKRGRGVDSRRNIQRTSVESEKEREREREKIREVKTPDRSTYLAS